MNRRAFVVGLLAGIFVSRAALAIQPDSEEVLVTEPEAEPFAVSYEDVAKVPAKYRRQEVAYATNQPPGSIVVDTSRRYLYFLLEGGRAIRYGIGVGRRGFTWAGAATIERKAEWPEWNPPKEMVARDPLAAKWANGMPGGPTNPLGARALYLFSNGVDTLYRIHGTSQPGSIGRAVSSGCVRLLNVDIIDLYNRVGEGTQVVVLQSWWQSPKVVSSQVPQVTRRTRLQLIRERLRNQSAAPQIVRKTNFNLRKP
jgi:lipoprotein-anchoring transpeptidase ErfK/SrfK